VNNPNEQTTPLTIRGCGESDLQAVQAIYAHHVLTGTASFEEIAPSVEELHARYKTVHAHGGPYVVAERNGLVVGYAYAGPYHVRSAFRYTVESTVYLDPSATRSGIARALMGVVIAKCESAGFRQMIAVIGGDNPASVAFHAAIGFRTVGKMTDVGFKFGRWLDTISMQRGLMPPQK
jgi:L-amino acid N-acyltransferase YncA